MSDEVEEPKKEAEEVKVVELVREKALRPPVRVGGSAWSRPWREGDVVDLLEGLLIWLDVAENVWFKDYLIDRKISLAFINNWANKCDSVNELLQIIKEKQESKFLKGGLLGGFQPHVTTFALKAVSGWRDKDESIKDHYNEIIKNKDMELDRMRAMSKWAAIPVTPTNEEDNRS